MRGSIVARGRGKWLVRVWLGYDDQRRQRFHNKTILGRRRDAEKYLAERLAEHAQAGLVATTRITLGEHLDYWLENVARLRLRRSSLTSYRETLDRYVPPWLLRRQVQAVTTDDLERLYRSLLVERGLSSRSVRYVHAIIRAALRQAKRKRHIIGHDPTEGVELPPEDSREMTALTLSESKKLIQALRQDERCGLLLELMLAVGLRPSEAIGLRLVDLDLEAGSLRVTQRIVHLRGRRKPGSPAFEVGPPKSRRSRRTLRIPPYLLARLGKQRKLIAERRLRTGPEWQDLGLLFPSETGTPISSRNLSMRHFKPALRRAGLPGSIRLYDLRHSHATLLTAAGVPLRVVADQLGHANPNVTVNTYQHVTADTLGLAADVFEKVVESMQSEDPT